MPEGETKNHAMLISGENNIIRDNKIYNSTGYGIRCYGYYNGAPDYCVIENNYIEQNFVGIVSPIDRRPYPAISLECFAFRNNKTVIEDVLIRNNKVVCLGHPDTRTVTRGIINVSGDKTATFRNINVINNSVVGSTIANEISVILSNDDILGVINIADNSIVTEGILPKYKGESSIIVYKGNVINIEKNSVIHNGKLDYLNNVGGVFDVQKSGLLNFYNNNCVARCNDNGQWFSKIETPIGEMSNNLINGLKTESSLIVFSGQDGNTLMLPVFGKMGTHFNLQVEPLNSYALKNYLSNPPYIESVSNGRITIRHPNIVKENAEYRIRVVYL